MPYQYQIVKGTGEVFKDVNAGVNSGNFRDFCRPYLTAPAHLGETLKVMRRRVHEQEWDVIFVASSVQHNTGRINMTDETPRRV